MPRLTVLDLRGDHTDPRGRLPRPEASLADARTAVAEILDAVRERGDAAVAEYSRRFDGVEPADGLLTPPDLLTAALEQLAPELRAALEQASDRIRSFHSRGLPEDWCADEDGVAMGQWHRPVARAGVYVPAGKSPLPSTVLMTVVPAQIAGVGEIVLCTPPAGGDGWPDRTILAAARLLGVEKVYRVGGAQAIAAMAYGTETVPACDVVVGPGNAYVTAAKQAVLAEGRCGIDLAAGPTEIAIVADDTADPAILAADLVAQAEHDELATCLLITPAAALVDPVEAALEREVASTRHADRVEAALHGQGTVALVDDLDHAVAVAEAFAAEHLEVHTRDAREVAARIRYAGTTFVGATTPVSLGDYAAGPNHTLPTSGTARFTGGLSARTFLVPVNWVEYDRGALADLAPAVRTLAAAEDLPAHARAVDVRLAPHEDGGADG